MPRKMEKRPRSGEQHALTVVAIGQQQQEVGLLAARAPRDHVPRQAHATHPDLVVGNVSEASGITGTPSPGWASPSLRCPLSADARRLQDPGFADLFAQVDSAGGGSVTRTRLRRR